MRSLVLPLCFSFLKCGYYEAHFQMCYNYGEQKGGGNEYMRKRSKKPLGKQKKMKKKRKNRKVREYEKIKMELTNLSPAERRRERILAEAEEKTAINTTPLTISVISMIFSWFAVFQSKIYEILKDWFQTLLEEYSNHAEIIQKIQQKMSDIQNSHIEIFGVVVVASAIAITIIRVHQLRLEKAARKNRIRLEILDEFFPDSKQKK